MAIMQIKDIDKDLFWEMAEKAESYEIHVVDDYLRMLTDKLREDTDIDFRVENYSLVNKQLGISIPSSEIKGYDSLLKKIENSLSASSVDNPYDVDTNKLVNEWGYSFSDTGMTPYYETSKRRWHAYDECPPKDGKMHTCLISRSGTYCIFLWLLFFADSLSAP